MNGMVGPEDVAGTSTRLGRPSSEPFSDGCWIARDRPDDTELIVVRAPALR